MYRSGTASSACASYRHVCIETSINNVQERYRVIGMCKLEARLYRDEHQQQRTGAVPRHRHVQARGTTVIIIILELL